MDKVTLKYGTTRRIAELTGSTEAWVSRCINGHRRPSIDLAQRIDATGLLPFSMVYRLIHPGKK